jgi:hypothetical protein
MVSKGCIGKTALYLASGSLVVAIFALAWALVALFDQTYTTTLQTGQCVIGVENGAPSFQNSVATVAYRIFDVGGMFIRSRCIAFAANQTMLTGSNGIRLMVFSFDAPIADLWHCPGTPLPLPMSKNAFTLAATNTNYASCTFVFGQDPLPVAVFNTTFNGAVLCNNIVAYPAPYVL